MTYAEYEQRETDRRNSFDYFRTGAEEEPEVNGPLPGAIDRKEACEFLGYKLDSWLRLITPTAGGYMWNAEPATNSIPAYLYDQLEDERREKDRAERARHTWGFRSDVDERPYFHDPARLAFDPYVAIHLDDKHQHEGVSLAEIWADPLARTFWLAIKARHITSQYFRGQCIAMARWARECPPRVAEDLSVGTGSGFMDLPSRYLRIQLYPYVVHELMAEGKWPYFHPGKACVSEHSLGWKRVDRRSE